MCSGPVEELTHTNAKRIKGIVDGEKIDYLYKGDVNLLIKEMADKNVTDLLIEEPSIDEIFMQFYEKEDAKLC